MKCFFYFLILMFAAFADTNAQSVAINTTGAAANTSAILDISSTSKGVLVPRMTKAQKNAIATPAAGLLIYQGAPDSIGFHYYNGIQWVWLNPSPAAGNDWSITGNVGTDTAVNFIGTTDNMPLAFRVNNENSGRIENTITSANTFLGFRSGRFTTGNFNTALGNRTLASNTSGNSNAAIGAFALSANQTGSDNIAFGQNALSASTNGFASVAIGSDALRTATSPVGLIAIGHNALYDNSTGFTNMAIGYEALRSNTTGSNNIAMGFQSLRTNTIGLLNYGIGYQSLFSNTSGAYNLAIGMEALRANTLGNFNIAIGGWQNMYRNTTGIGNISIGAEYPNSTLYNNTTGVRNIAIGSNLNNNTTGSSNIALGYFALNNTQTKDGNIAIGNGALLNNGMNAPLAIHAVNNIALGHNALIGNKRGSSNIAIGLSAAFTDTAQFYNVAIGNYALYLSEGNHNVGIGTAALMNNQGSSNVAIGDSAAQNVSASGIVAIGNLAMKNTSTGSSLVAIGDSALYSNTTGYKNIAMGNSAQVKNTTGFQNIGIGYNTLKSNLTGFANIAIGDSALSANTTNWNIALGRNALLETTTGDKNIAVGDGALSNNLTGANNVAVGYAAQISASTNNKNNTSLGFRSAYSMQGYSNTAIGGDVMGKPAVSYTVNNTVAIGDSVLFNIATGASNNTAVGTKALYSNTSGRTNTAFGARALYDNTTGNNNVAIGDSAGYNNTVSNLVAIGSKALWNNTIGTGNTAVGYQGMFSNVTGSTNTAVGNSAGYLNTGSGNVFVGYNAGYSEAGSNKLYIDNSNTTTPLVYGDFSTNVLRVNGTLNINNDYSFPIADGTAAQVLRTDGVGNVSWATVSGEATTANNGLTLTGSNVALGGTLVSNTTITHGNFNLTHSLSGSGDFIITTPTRPTAFTVLNTGDVGVNGNDFYVANSGNVGINSSVPSARLHVVNGVSGSANNYSSGLLIENTAGAAGQALLAFKNFVLPGNRAWITGMNTFDNYVIAYGDSLSGTNVVMRVDTAGYVSINPAGAPNSRLDVTGSFGNAIRITTVSTSLDEDDHTVIIGPAAGAVTITLPSAAITARREYVIVNRSASLQAISSYQDFSGSAATVQANNAITIQSNGTNWFRIR